MNDCLQLSPPRVFATSRNGCTVHIRIVCGRSRKCPPCREAEAPSTRPSQQNICTTSGSCRHRANSTKGGISQHLAYAPLSEQQHLAPGYNCQNSSTCCMRLCQNSSTPRLATTVRTAALDTGFQVKRPRQGGLHSGSEARPTRDTNPATSREP